MHESAITLSRAEGFTLAEAAIVIAIIAVVIGALVPSLLSMRVAEQARTTSQMLQTALRSITAYAQSKGCVPCPAVPAGNGLVGLSVSGASCGACAVAVGVLPFASLGLPESMAKDGYGHWMTYAVDSALTAVFTPVAPATSVIPPEDKNGLCQSGIANPKPVKVTLSTGDIQNAAVLLVSHGANGYGAYQNTQENGNDRIPFPPFVASCASGLGAERCNADDDIAFVASGIASASGPFDDQMLYLDRNALVAYLGNKPCQTSYP